MLVSFLFVKSEVMTLMATLLTNFSGNLIYSGVLSVLKKWCLNCPISRYLPYYLPIASPF